VDWIQLAQDRNRKAGSCEHSNGTSASIKGEKFIDQLSDSQLINKNSVPWS